MKKTKLVKHLTDDELLARMNNASNIKFLKRWQILWFVQAKNMCAIHAAENVGHAKSLACYWIKQYNKFDPEIIEKVKTRNSKTPENQAFTKSES